MKSVAMLREGMCAHLSRKLVLTAVLDEEGGVQKMMSDHGGI